MQKVRGVVQEKKVADIVHALLRTNGRRGMERGREERRGCRRYDLTPPPLSLSLFLSPSSLFLSLSLSLHPADTVSVLCRFIQLRQTLKLLSPRAITAFCVAVSDRCVRPLPLLLLPLTVAICSPIQAGVVTDATTKEARIEDILAARDDKLLLVPTLLPLVFPEVNRAKRESHTHIHHTVSRTQCHAHTALTFFSPLFSSLPHFPNFRTSRTP